MLLFAVFRFSTVTKMGFDWKFTYTKKKIQNLGRTFFLKPIMGCEVFFFYFLAGGMGVGGASGGGRGIGLVVGEAEAEGGARG